MIVKMKSIVRFLIPAFLTVLIVSCVDNSTLSESATIVAGQLSSPRITCFLQDTTGRMWIGTERGLNRYNGYDFHQYYYHSDTTSLPGSFIYDLCLDTKGQLWIGTENGVARYTDSDRFERIPILSEEKPVYQILCDSKGQVILNMLEDLCVLDSLGGVFTSRTFSFDRYYSYRSRCYLTDDDLLWVVSPMEVRCFSTDGFQNIDNYPTPSFVTESVMRWDGQIWMAGRRKMCIFDTASKAFKRMPAIVTERLANEEIELMAEIDSSSVLFKTSSGLMCLYDSRSDDIQDITQETLDLSHEFNVKIVHKDTAGNLWLGSDDRGINYIRTREGDFSHIGLSRRILENKSIVSVSADPEGNLWMFTLRDGLYRMDHNNGNVVNVEIAGVSQSDGTDVLQSNPPLVFVSSKGDIWLSFPNQQRVFRGCYYDGKVYLQDEYPAFYPRVAAEDSDGGIWFGTRDEYLVYVAPGASKALRVQIYPVETTFINSILPIGDELLVLAYNEPVMLLDIHTLTSRRLEMNDMDEAVNMTSGLFHPTVAQLDSAGNVWIGTRFNGLLKYNQGTRALVRIWDITSDVASIEITSGGQVWVSTADGMAYVSTGDGFSKYIPQKGKSNNTFYERSSEKLADGRLVFGGVGGITIVDPDDIAPAHATPLVFEDIKVHNVTVAPGTRIIDKSLSLKPDIELLNKDNTFSISFSVPDFTNSQSAQFQYKLEGYDRDWVELGANREAFFANIPAGRYVLRVRHYLSSGIMMGEEHLNITIQKPVLLSNWAICLYIILLVVIILQIIRIRNQFAIQRAAARDAEQAKEQERHLNMLNMALFANVSHEFRTPLTMIYGPVSQLSRSKHLNREEKDLVSMMGRNVNRMLSLVNQLLDVSKLEKTTIDLRVRKIDIVRVLKETMDSFRYNAKSFGLTMDDSGMENPMIVWCDEDKIKKIMSNLISNAIKFTKSGGQISIALDRVKEGTEPYILISVTDTGEGIPEDKLEKIFERFYQLGNQATKSYGFGTGIGLFYARTLANVHHGSLKAGNRTDGHGAVFTLLIPADPEKYPENERVYDDTQLPTSEFFTDALNSEDVSGSNEETLPLILAVDDDPDVLNYLQILFSGPYRVLTATSASEARQKAQNQIPDIVLSDVAMPDKSGYDLCEEFKSDLQLSHVPFILVTAMGSVDNQVTGLNLGADAYVTKPFNPSYLKAMVKSLLDNRKRIQQMMGQVTDTSEVEDSLSVRDKAFMDQVYALMEKELSNEDMDITTLCDILHISRTKLYYKIKALTGNTPSGFFLQYKLNRAAKMLREGELNVTEIAIKTGFSTLPSFSKAFKKQYGVSPSKY